MSSFEDIEEQRAVIRFFVLKNQKLGYVAYNDQRIHEELVLVYGDKAYSYERVKDLAREIRLGPRPGEFRNHFAFGFTW